MNNVNICNVQRVVKELATGCLSKYILTPDDWKVVSKDALLTQSFMDEFNEFLNWDYLVMYQKMSEELMDKYKDKLDWKKVCIHQQMTEEFMVAHEDRLSWKEVWYCQSFSDDFYTRYESHLKYYKDKGIR